MGSLVQGIHELYESAWSEDALDDDGYILTYEGAATPGNVIKCPNTAQVAGIGYTSTKSPITGSAVANYVTLIKHGLANVLLAATHAAIAKGDPLCVSATDGKATKMAVPSIRNDSTANVAADVITAFDTWRTYIGTAQEAKAVNESGKCLTSLVISGHPGAAAAG